MTLTARAIAALVLSLSAGHALADQVPGAAAAPAIPISSQDRFYSADQFSNTVSVVDPSTNRLLGVISLGDPTPANLSPLYRGQLLVHGIGAAPDGKTLAVVSIGSNAVSFIDTATNTVKHTTYVGRSPHEAFFTPDGREVWVTVRGEAYVSVLDATTYQETARVQTPNGPGMTIFSPDGAYAYICSSFSPETVVVDTRSREVVGRVRQDSPFCPDIAATPDGEQVWLTLKDLGKTMVFQARPPFAVLQTLDTGPLTNHVNIVRNAVGQFAYVTVGTENRVKVYRTDTFAPVTEIEVGALPHGLWPSGDGSRIYVGLENGDGVAVIDTASNRVVETVPIGQGPQGVTYVPRAVTSGDGMANLTPLGEARASHQLMLTGAGGARSQATLFNQGQVQMLQVAAAGLEPGKPYILAFASHADGSGELEPLTKFMANPAGAAVVNAVGPIRQVVAPEEEAPRRWLVIAAGTPEDPGAVVQTQAQ